uniref:Uncharacterized protein n=1 Tax=Rhodococcus sp. NS1 TaxID=402236 RepID=A0A097SPX5_9NOCA|nr:hypothetical protein LRS1606.137 [Rhodococcus sp. NS1]
MPRHAPIAKLGINAPLNHPHTVGRKAVSDVYPEGHAVVRAYPQRARYDRETADSFLDAGWMGHLATTMDDFPHIVPMMYIRRDNHLYLHGRRGTPLMIHLCSGAKLAFEVTIVDGLVLSRDVRWNTVNYRSVVIHGTATVVDEQSVKSEILSALAERVWPGRIRALRPPTDEQLSYVELLAVPIKVFSAKIRTGPSLASTSDADPQIWAGHIDLRMTPSAYHPDAATAEGIAPPSWVFQPPTC